MEEVTTHEAQAAKMTELQGALDACKADLAAGRGARRTSTTRDKSSQVRFDVVLVATRSENRATQCAV